MSSHSNDKGTDKRERERENISQRVKDAEVAIKALVRSIAMNVEEKIGIENQINIVAQGAESMLGRIDAIREANQKKLLLKYKEFLEKNLEAVNRRLKDLG